METDYTIPVGTPPSAINKNIINLKKPIKRAGFFLYLFFEWPNIRNFASKVPIIKVQMLNFQISVGKSNWEAVRRDASFALGHMKFVLENGWMVLGKFEYNLLCVSYRLFEEILAITINHFYDAEYLLNKFSRVEAYFLACHYKPEYPEMIAGSAAAVLRHYKKTDDKIDGLVYFIKRILIRTGDSVTLHNILIAANMIVFRKFLNLGDLIGDYKSGIISSSDFDCPPEIKMKIAAFIRESEMKLEQLQAEKKGLQKAGQFMNVNSGKTSDREYGDLVRFYDTYSGPDKSKFIVDRDNINLLAANFIKRFFWEFEVLLNGKMQIEGYGEIQAFSYEFFMNDMGKLQALIKAFTAQKMAIVRINHARLSEIKKGYTRADVTPEESEAFGLINELSEIIIEIGKKTGHIFTACRYGSAPGEENQEIEKEKALFKNIDLSCLARTKIYVPFADKKILKPGYLKDKPFSEALSMISAVCFDAGRYMQNDEIINYRDSESRVSEEIGRITETLERVADKVTFEKIKKVYNI